jgi:hypothetical protein
MQRIRNNVEILGAEQMKFHKFNPETHEDESLQAS